MTLLNMLTTSTFECVLFFQIEFLLPNLLSSYKTNKGMATKHFTGRRIGFFCQTRFKQRIKFQNHWIYHWLVKRISPYMYYDNQTSTFVQISTSLNGFSCLTPDDSFTEYCGHVKEQDVVFLISCKRFKQEYQAYLYITTDSFARLQEILINISIYISEFYMETALFVQ